MVMPGFLRQQYKDDRDDISSYGDFSFDRHASRASVMCALFIGVSSSHPKIKPPPSQARGP